MAAGVTERVSLAADFSSPFANSSTEGLGYINSDVTVYLHRLPATEWIGFEVADHHATDGVAIGECWLYDEQGPIGQASCAALAQRPFLILSDVNMPLMDGVEFCRRVRAHSLVGHTPLVFLSGWDDYKERYRGLEAGGDEYLSKFTPVRELLLRVQLILGRYAGLGRGPEEGLAGDIALVGPAGLLQVCHLTRLTGIAEARSGDEAFEARFRRGELVGARLSELEGEIAVFSFLTWTAGRFRFAAGDPGDGPPLGESFDQLILEGCRRLDESRLQR